MIGRIRGLLLEIQPPDILLDVGGLGYEVQVPMTTLYELPEPGTEITLFTHFVVREDAQLLYGFLKERERGLFRHLIKVNGVGPKLGLAILSGMDADSFVRAVQRDDTSTLVQLPGVGKKTAERLLVEMRDKLSDWLLELEQVAPATPESRDIVAEAESALVALGYKPAEANKAVTAANDGSIERSEDLIRRALQSMVGSKMIETDRLVAPEEEGGREDVIDRAIRPRALDEYVGQPGVREQMQIFISAAKARSEALDHTLIFGPPGLGKTTLAHIIANEMGGDLKSTSGPVLEKAGDIAALMTNLEPGDVLFIDEIHRLSPYVEEVLYPAMEDYQLDIMIGEGPAARSIKLDIPPFTLVGATTRAGLLTSPLRDRFGIVQRLEFYSVPELGAIVQRSGNIMGVQVAEEGAHEIARRSRGTPRIANRLLRRVRDYAEVKGDGHIDAAIAADALDLLDVDQVGFDNLDRRLLQLLIEKFDGGPVGVESLAAALSEERGTIEDVIEPYLLQQGYLMRTARGRMATRSAWQHFGLAPPGGQTDHNLALDLGDGDDEQS